MDLNFELIYVMLGVNNLSRKIENGKIVPVFEDVPSLIEFMLTKFEIFVVTTRPIPIDNRITETTSLPGTVHVVLKLGVAPAAHTETRVGTTGATTTPEITGQHAPRGAGADHLMTVADNCHTNSPSGQTSRGNHHARASNFQGGQRRDRDTRASRTNQ